MWRFLRHTTRLLRHQGHYKQGHYIKVYQGYYVTMTLTNHRLFQNRPTLDAKKMHFRSSESRESRTFGISALKTIILRNKTKLFFDPQLVNWRGEKINRQWRALDKIFQMKLKNLTLGSPVTSQVRSNTKCVRFRFNAFPPQNAENKHISRLWIDMIRVWHLSSVLSPRWPFLRSSEVTRVIWNSSRKSWPSALIDAIILLYIFY